MSNPRVEKLQLLGRMLRYEHERINRFIESDRLKVSEEAINFSRSIIESQKNNEILTSDDVMNIYKKRFERGENNREYRLIAEIVAEEFDE